MNRFKVSREILNIFVVIETQHARKHYLTIYALAKFGIAIGLEVQVAKGREPGSPE